MEKINKQPKCVVVNKRLRNTIHNSALSSKGCQSTDIDQRTKITSEPENPRNVEGAICISPNKTPNQQQFIRNLFVTSKKDGGEPSSNKPERTEFIYPLPTLQYGKFGVKHMFQKNDFMCKLDLKDAYFCMPLHKNSRKFVELHWSGNLYQFICLCFGLGPAPRIFTKFLKIPMAILRRINIRILIYLDDMLVVNQSREVLLKDMDAVIFLLRHLGFVINLKKSVLEATQNIEFLPWLCH